MNKSKFVDSLMKETNYDREKCIEINKVLESHFIIGKKGKEKIVDDFVNKIGVDSEEAEHLYEVCISILGVAAKEKIRHPFKSKD